MEEVAGEMRQGDEGEKDTPPQKNSLSTCLKLSKNKNKYFLKKKGRIVFRGARI